LTTMVGFSPAKEEGDGRSSHAKEEGELIWVFPLFKVVDRRSQVYKAQARLGAESASTWSSQPKSYRDYTESAPSQSKIEAQVVLRRGLVAAPAGRVISDSADSLNADDIR